jgi:hypothetical protein
VRHGFRLLRRSLHLFAYSGIGVAATAPALTYSTYLQSNLTPNAIASDSWGDIYLAGSAVIKLNPRAGEYLYTTPLRGQTNNVANAIAVDGAGNAYVAGYYRTAQGSTYSFMAKLDSNGNIVFSIPLGGSV